MNLSQKKEVGDDGKNHKMIKNSLNIGNGMGLDKILKRAIEKVRSSKVEDLMVTKVEPEKEHEDSL